MMYQIHICHILSTTIIKLNEKSSTSIIDTDGAVSIIDGEFSFNLIIAVDNQSDGI